MRVLIVDDHAIVREGLRRVLEDEFPDLGIAEATNAHQALEQVAEHAWEVIVLDISLPGRGGLDTLKEILRIRPGARVLVMTMYSEEQYALRAFRAGASGYVTKGSASEEVLKAVRKVAEGGRYVTPGLAEHLAAHLSAPREGPAHEVLSDRELQVLRMLALGKKVKDIGNELHLSEKTVSTYRTRILEKMKLESTAELISYAIRAGLID